MKNKHIKLLTIIILLLSIHQTFGIDNQKANNGDLFSKEQLQYDFANGLFSRKLFTEAITEYQTFIDKFRNSKKIPEVRFRLAESYFSLGKYEIAENLLTSIIKGYRTSSFYQQALLKLGCCQYERKKFQKSDGNS